MSCVYRALPRIIPNLLLSAKKSTNVAIISPWIQDVMLQVPIIFGIHHRYKRKMYLGQFLRYLIDNRQLEIFLIVRDNDKRVQYVTRRVQRKSLHIHTVEYLHAKAIVTESNALLTSANLIPTSLYRNIENCSLQINQYQSTAKYLKYEYGIKFT